MKTVTITVGWTKSDGERDEHGRIVRLTYSSFDGWQRGASQHTETLTFDVPEDYTDEQICEAAFTATNIPDPSYLTDLVAARVLRALTATGYRGQGAHYSLSVGDTVTIGGTRYACENAGWRLAEYHADLTDEELLALTRDPDSVVARQAELAYAERDTDHRKEASPE